LKSSGENKSLDAFKNWVSEEELNTLDTSYNKRALIAYIKESTDTFLNKQEEEKQLDRVIKKDLSQHEREVKRLQEVISDPSVTINFQQWMDYKEFSIPENAQKRELFVSRFNSAFNFPADRIVDQNAINQVLMNRLGALLRDKKIDLTSDTLSDSSEKILKNVRKSVEKDMDRLWK
jgi:hypothetical protein